MNFRDVEVGFLHSRLIECFVQYIGFGIAFFKFLYGKVAVAVKFFAEHFGYKNFFAHIFLLNFFRNMR